MLLGALPVDAQVSPDGTTLSVVTAGNGQVQQVPMTTLSEHDDDGCKDSSLQTPLIGDDLGQPTSVAYTPDGALVVYYPELPAIVVHVAAGEDVHAARRLRLRLGPRAVPHADRRRPRVRVVSPRGA